MRIFLFPMRVRLSGIKKAESTGVILSGLLIKIHKNTGPAHQVGTDKEVPNKPTHSRTLKPKRQGADPGPLFFHVPDRPHRFPQGNARASAGRIRATEIPTGASLPHTASLSAGNCHGAEPTFDPALLPAADNRPAVNRGGPPSRRHPSNATFNTKSCLLATYITHLSAADFCDNRYIYTTTRTHHTALYCLRTTKLTKPFLSMGGGIRHCCTRSEFPCKVPPLYNRLVQ